MTLEEELTKLRIEHRLQLWRTAIDKLLLGIVISGIVFLGNMYLEQHKATLNQQRFMLESRLKGLTEIRDAYSKMSEYMINAIISSENPIDTKIRTGYMQAYQKFLDATNKWSMLFSSNFSEQMQHHAWIHGACATDEVTFSTEYYLFAAHIFQAFDDVTRKALWKETLGLPSDVSLQDKFDIELWTPLEMTEKGLKHFFDLNFKKWQLEQKKKQEKL